MLTPYAMEKQAEFLRKLFDTAEIELGGVMKQMNLTSVREEHKVRFLIHVPAMETGAITKRRVKDASGKVVWEDRVSLIKPNREITLEIPVELAWKGAER